MARATLQRCGTALRLAPRPSVCAGRVRSFTTISRHHGANHAGLARSAIQSDLKPWTVENEVSELLRARPAHTRDDSAVSTYDQYQANAGRVLDHVLPYDAYPSEDRRAGKASTEIVLVVHVVEDGSGAGDVEHVLSSGFVVEGRIPGSEEVDRFVISCAHTLEQIEHRIPSAPKRSYILCEGRSGIKELVTVDEVVTSSPKTDLIVGRLPRNAITTALHALPVNPYPMYRGQEVLLHLFNDSPDSDRRSWGTWTPGVVLGYRGHGWEEVEPGTSSALPYILVSTLPSSGSSGGPVVDAASGAVVGIISGRRMDNRVEKERGWGSSAESIFELFSIPGFVPASTKRKRAQQ